MIPLCEAAEKAGIVKSLVWSQSRVFGYQKRRGTSPFGEWVAFEVEGLTAEQIAAMEAVAQDAYAKVVLSALNPTLLSELDTAKKEVEMADHAASCLADMVNELQPALTEAKARIAELEGDKRRMDWLVSQDVDVRTPLVYGSRKLFAAQAVGGLDADDAYRTTLREQIDAALPIPPETKP